MFRQSEGSAILSKAADVITSSKTPAQLRVASAYAYRAIATIGQLLGDAAFKVSHDHLHDLLNAKVRSMRGARHYWDF